MQLRQRLEIEVGKSQLVKHKDTGLYPHYIYQLDIRQMFTIHKSLSHTTRRKEQGNNTYYMRHWLIQLQHSQSLHYTLNHIIYENTMYRPWGGNCNKDKFRIETDASEHIIGGVFSQEQEGK